MLEEKKQVRYFAGMYSLVLYNYRKCFTEYTYKVMMLPLVHFRPGCVLADWFYLWKYPTLMVAYVI